MVGQQWLHRQKRPPLVFRGRDSNNPLIWAKVGIHTSSSYDGSSTAGVDSNECNTQCSPHSHSGFVVLFNADLSFSKGIFWYGCKHIVHPPIFSLCCRYFVISKHKIKAFKSCNCIVLWGCTFWDDNLWRFSTIGFLQSSTLQGCQAISIGLIPNWDTWMELS